MPKLLRSFSVLGALKRVGSIVSLCVALATSTGAVAIEQIRAGDIVWSADEVSGEMGLRPVLETYRNQATEIWEIAYDHDRDAQTPAMIIASTGEHPFWEVDSSAFLPAEELRPGNTLRLLDGNTVNIEGVTKRPSDRITATYNFAVADHHTYFAGEGGVWVHNLCKAALDRYAATHKTILDKALESGASPADALDEALEGIIRKSQADELDELEMDEVLAYVYDQLPDDALTSQAVSQWDEIMHVKSVNQGNRARGNLADDVRSVYYRTQGGASEVFLQHPQFPDNPKKYFKLDNYIPGEEIVSRKDTYDMETIWDGLIEMNDKYVPGRIIQGKPSNIEQLGQQAVGIPIDGKMILEIPAQDNPLSDGVLLAAENYGIMIRDYSGKVLFNPSP